MIIYQDHAQTGANAAFRAQLHCGEVQPPRHLHLYPDLHWVYILAGTPVSALCLAGCIFALRDRSLISVRRQHSIAMPLVGVDHSLNLVGDEAPYFTSLEELDSWMDKPSKELRSVLPYTPRSRTASAPKQGRLLVRPVEISVKNRSSRSHSQGLSRLQGKTNSRLPYHLKDMNVDPSATRGDTMRNPRNSHIPSISGHIVKPLSSAFCVYR